jgi:hypothetical protein
MSADTGTGKGAGLAGRFGALPRATRWLIIGGALVVGYFAVIEPAIDYGAVLGARADRAEQAIAQQGALARQAQQAGGLIARGLTAHGVPPFPAASADPLDALNKRIDRVARDHSVAIKRRTERARSAVAGVEWAGKRLERVGIDVTIECDTDQLAAVLKDMEAAPEVHVLAQVRIQKLGGGGGGGAGAGGIDAGLLQVTLVPESFVLPRASGGAGAGGAGAGGAR